MSSRSTIPLENPAVVLPTVFPSAGAAGPSSVSLPAAVNPNLQMPYSMQYSFTIEHSRWDTGFRASYIGTNTRQGDYGYNYNSPVPDSRLFIDKPRPFPQYPGDQLLHQRRRPSVPQLDGRSGAPHGAGPSVPELPGCGRATSATWSAGRLSRIHSTGSAK